jgi:hypothetical protein
MTLWLAVAPAAGGSAREALEEARKAATAIDLGGDQSAALREIAVALTAVDLTAALDTVARIRRPADAARALGAAAAARAAAQQPEAVQNATAAGRLLLRLANPERRAMEQTLLVSELAVLGRYAPVAAPELPTAEAELAVVLGRARTDPEAAAALFEEWALTGRAADRALEAIAAELAASRPDRALELASAISSGRQRDRVLALIAERRPAEEATAIAGRTSDPVVRSAVLASGAARMGLGDPEAAVAAAEVATVARDSAVAQVAAETGGARALEIARRLPERPRRWVLARVAVKLASREPERAEAMLEELGRPADAVRACVAEMMSVDAERAIRIARGMPEGLGRDGALAAAASRLPAERWDIGAELAWEIADPVLQARAVEQAAVGAAPHDLDAATSPIGLVSDPQRAARVRAAVAAAIAPDDQEAAVRLLESLPDSEYKAEAALKGAVAALAAGGSRRRRCASRGRGWMGTWRCGGRFRRWWRARGGVR